MRTRHVVDQFAVVSMILKLEFVMGLVEFAGPRVSRGIAIEEVNDDGDDDDAIQDDADGRE